MQVLAVMVIAFGMYVLASMYWISDLVEVREADHHHHQQQQGRQAGRQAGQPTTCHPPSIAMSWSSP